MNLTGYISLFAGLFITGSFVPQIIRVFRLKSAREISTLFTSFLLVGMALWLIYGVKQELAPIIFWNAIGIVQVILLLYAKMKYGR